MPAFLGFDQRSISVTFVRPGQMWDRRPGVTGYRLLTDLGDARKGLNRRRPDDGAEQSVPERAVDQIVDGVRRLGRVVVDGSRERIDGARRLRGGRLRTRRRRPGGSVTRSGRLAGGVLAAEPRAGAYGRLNRPVHRRRARL